MAAEHPLKEKAGRAPERPGVYLWRDRSGRVLYIGKAKELRARLASYFAAPAADVPRLVILRAEAVDLDWIETGNEVEALILEDRLIKKHRPRLNVRLRDDKTYPYLKLHLRDRFPYLEVTRHVTADGSLYFGPYVSARNLRLTVRAIHAHFRLRQCRGAISRQARGCVNVQIGRCDAPCLAGRNPADYARTVREVILLLRGRSGELTARLAARMEQAATRLEFEEAARLRDQIAAVRQVTQGHRALASKGEDQDVLGVARRGEAGVLEVYHVRQGRLTGRSRVAVEGAAGPEPEVVQELMVRYYGKEIAVPPEILLPVELPARELIAGWLAERRGGRVRIAAPQRGRKAALVAMAARSAASWLQLQARAAPEEAEMEALQAALGLSRRPRRIEGYDVSTIAGSFTVASLVAFEDGRPRPARHRRYRIRTPGGPDDYAAMREVLARRLARRDQPGWELPDLFLIDGGRGHLETAAAVLAELGHERPELASIAKQRGRRVAEGIFVAGRPGEIRLPDGPALHLVQRVRDEAHRRAIAYHRKLRGLAQTRSLLEQVPGVGPRRRTALLRHLGSLANLRRATVEEIAAVPGIDRRTAEAVRHLLDHLDDQEGPDGREAPARPPARR